MTRNGHHIIQKRDLLEMLRGVPECEHIAVQVDGPAHDEMPMEPKALSKAKGAYEQCGGTPEAKAYIALLEERVDDLERAFPEPEDDDKRTEFMAIDSIHRSHSVTHLVCGI